jgi:hypothetical protein
MRSARLKADLTGVGRLLDDLVRSGIVPGANALLVRGGTDAYYHEAGVQDVASW